MHSQERDVIEIQPELVPDVIKLFEADFSKMASCLQAQDDKVVLLNPRLSMTSDEAPKEQQEQPKTTHSTNGQTEQKQPTSDQGPPKLDS